MRFSVVTVLQVLCASAIALPSPQAAAPKTPPKSATVDLTGQKAADGTFTVKAAPEDPNSQNLQKRIAPVVAVIGIAAVAGLGKLTELAIEVGSNNIAALGKWNEARETFSKTTTQDMFNRNPDFQKFPAAACYNKAYDLKDPAGFDGKVSAKLSLELLNTDYDCLYMTANNQFFTRGDTGFANLAFTYDVARCSFDQKTGDLSCGA